MNPSGATLFLWDTGNKIATEKGYWRYAAAYQRFMEDIPLSNGRYRNIEAKVADPALVVIGQKDVQDGQAHFFVYNRAGNWYTLARNPANVKPASGQITVAGMPNGRYTVETWDTSRGRVRDTMTANVMNGVFSVMINRLFSDMAFKVYSAAKDRSTALSHTEGAKVAKNL